MSQPSSSSDVAATAMAEKQGRECVDDYLAQGLQPGFRSQLLMRLQNPFTDAKGFRVNPLWVSLTVLFVLALSVFFYFNH